jgi:hypothetical protein
MTDSQTAVCSPNYHKLTQSLVEEPEGSTSLIPKPAFGHDAEPVSSVSHPHNIMLLLFKAAAFKGKKKKKNTHSEDPRYERRNSRSVSTVRRRIFFSSCLCRVLKESRECGQEFKLWCKMSSGWDAYTYLHSSSYGQQMIRLLDSQHCYVTAICYTIC